MDFDIPFAYIISITNICNQFRLRRKMKMNEKAVSPVIATVILVAVAITVAVAVSYWMGSIAGMYTKFEKIEIQSSYASKTTGGPLSTLISTGWTVTIKLKNSGSATSTLIQCFVNDKPVDEYMFESLNTLTWQYLDEVSGAENIPLDGLTIESGESATIFIYMEAYTDDGTGTLEPTDITFTSGTTINFKLHSAAGMDYIKLVQLT